MAFALALLSLGALTGCQTGPPSGPASRRPIPTSAWEQEARRWQGTPYRYGGTSRRGIDCSAFVQEMYRAVAGVPLPRTTAQQCRVGAAVSPDRLRPGDLLFFNTSGRGVSHVGLSLGGDRFVHASSSRGVTTSSLRDRYYGSRFIGARRVLR